MHMYACKIWGASPGSRARWEGIQHLRERKGHKKMGGSVYDRPSRRVAERSTGNASGSQTAAVHGTCRVRACRAVLLSAPFVNKWTDVELFADRNGTEEPIKNVIES